MAWNGIAWHGMVRLRAARALYYFDIFVRGGNYLALWGYGVFGSFAGVLDVLTSCLVSDFV